MLNQGTGSSNNPTRRNSGEPAIPCCLKAVRRNLFRISFLLACLFVLAPENLAQSASGEPFPPLEQNETMIDTLKRMQIKREEEEHRKLVEKAAIIKDGADEIAAKIRTATAPKLPRSFEKTLKDIEKYARQIRSGSGGSRDNPLDHPPADISAAIKQLKDASNRLNENLAKTSRQVISLSVIGNTCEIIELVKYLREHLN